MDVLESLSGQPILLAIFISLGLSCIIAVAGVIPSTFVTAANILYFGFAGGLALSITGEAIGAVISFIFYRKGIRKLEEKISGKKNWSFLERLKDTKGLEAFILVLALRVFPFAPSGLVTLAASISKMGLLAFTISSTIGKFPALLIEAYSVETVLGWKGEYQLAAVIFALTAGVWYYWTTKSKKRRM
jgi:uncharacterized membrane protein YdjX (TVP38/TMEM64 family)